MAVQITPQEMNNLKAQGFTEEEINKAAANVILPVQQTIDPRALSQQSMFATKPEENLVKWQTELNDILEKIEHILRGDVPKYKEGIMIWDKNPDPGSNPLNKLGIQEVMKILAMYINRNTILSDYTHEEIKAKVFDFGRTLNNFIFMKYDELGMNTEDKRKAYQLLVHEIVDQVHSAYNRALHGGERRSLREMISISQNQQMAPIQPGQLPGSKERSVLNPMRVIRGKYI